MICTVKYRRWKRSCKDLLSTQNPDILPENDEELLGFWTLSIIQYSKKH
jgi:hypothetical protein